MLRNGEVSYEDLHKSKEGQLVGGGGIDEKKHAGMPVEHAANALKMDNQTPRVAMWRQGR